jgi:hypothetical protein
MEFCCNCDMAIKDDQTPFVWCDEVVCRPCWLKLDALQRRNNAGGSRRTARDRLAFAAASAIVSGIGSLYLLAGVEYELPGACTIGGAALLTGLVLVVVARPWSPRSWGYLPATPFPRSPFMHDAVPKGEYLAAHESSINRNGKDRRRDRF